MENASDALMMAFGVLIFVLALTVAINAFSQAREVSDVVLYSADETNFYEYKENADGVSQENRIVGLETIIPTLYKYYKENYTVVFLKGEQYNKQDGTFGKITRNSIYELKDTKRVWRIDSAKYWEKIQNKYSRFVNSNEFNHPTPTSSDLYNIFSFDLEEEQMRNEPWTISEDEIKKNLDSFIYGGTYNMPSNNKKYIEYKGLLNEHSEDRFVEYISEIETETEVTDDTDGTINVSELKKKKTKKKIYIFILINSVKSE